jgi:hypothetical protein
MPIVNYLENNFPALVSFLGVDDIQAVFNLTDKFLELDSSDEEIFKCLDKEFYIKKSGELLLACDYSKEIEMEKRKLQILKILEDCIKGLISKVEKSNLNNIKEKLKDPENMWQGLHEVYVAARLCEISEDIELEVPNSDKPLNNFDIKANINGTEINIEVTTRTDYFPFGKEFLRRMKNGEAESEVWAGPHSRATVAPAFADDNRPSSPKIKHDSIPESEDLRRKLLEKAKRQLPKNETNIIALGYGGTTVADFHTTNALYGDPKYEFNKSQRPEERTLFTKRVKNGLIYEEDFKHISAVMLLSPHNNDGTLYINPNSDKRLPSTVQELFVKIFNLNLEM